MDQGIRFALVNMKRNRTAGWASGSEADRLPRAERAAFAAGVQLVEDLQIEQQTAVRHLLNGSASMADAAGLPVGVVTVLRAMDRTFDYTASLVDSGVAKVSLPPYDY